MLRSIVSFAASVAEALALDIGGLRWSKISWPENLLQIAAVCCKGACHMCRCGSAGNNRRIMNVSGLAETAALRHRNEKDWFSLWSLVARTEQIRMVNWQRKKVHTGCIISIRCMPYTGFKEQRARVKDPGMKVHNVCGESSCVFLQATYHEREQRYLYICGTQHVPSIIRKTMFRNCMWLICNPPQ